MQLKNRQNFNEKSTKQLHEQQLLSLNHQKSIQQLRKLLQINDNTHNIIKFEKILNKNSIQQMTQRNTKFSRIRQPKIQKIPKNIIELPNIQELSKLDQLQKDNPKILCIQPNSERINRQNNTLLNHEHQALIQQYLEKIKKQNLFLKYESKEQLIRVACDHIRQQMQKKIMENERRKQNKIASFTTNPYHIRQMNKSKRQSLSIPAFFRKSKRGSYGSIGNVTLIHDIQTIKKNQILEARQRQRQERVFLRKMKIYGIHRDKSLDSGLKTYANID